MNRPSTTAWMARCVIANWGASELWVGGELRKRFVMMVGRLVILAFGWTAPQGVSQVIFSDPVSLGLAKVSGLKQASGLVSSRRNEDVIWTHNDAGDLPRIFAIDTQGQYLGTYTLPGALHVDYEDIAIGPGPVTNVHYLFVGDIGDNKAKRQSIQVYRIPEPVVSLRQSTSPLNMDLRGVESITLIYPDGAHNAETLLMDPLSGDLFVVTKQPGVAEVYQATKNQLESETGVVALTHVGSIPFNVASGGDISPNGLEIVIRQEDFARLWVRTNHQSVAEALQSTPTSIPLVGRPTEPNGEAIGFDHLGNGYFTLSDSASTQPLYYVSRVSKLSSGMPQTLLSAGATWSYFDSGSDPGIGWQTNGTVEVAWKKGEGQFGFGDGDERTVTSYRPGAGTKQLTTYFRTTFLASDLPQSFQLELDLLFNDGVAVYLNGTLITLDQLSPDPTYLTPASELRGALENTWRSYVINAGILVNGTNTLSAEVHLTDRSRSHLSFDAQLTLLEKHPMKIHSLARRSDGQIELKVQGDLAELVIEGASNLNDWWQLGTVALWGGKGQFLVPDRHDAPRFFFRLRAP